MLYDLTSSTARGATISKPTTALSSLPLASTAFGSREPWSVITTRTLTSSLGIDRGNFATWRCRGIGPVELPTEWFRPASGSPCYYMISDVMAWLAHRADEPFDASDAYLDHLRAMQMPANLVWVRRMAEREGPVQGTVRFTPSGWRAYLDRLAPDW